MPVTPSSPTIVIAMNAFRPGGSQTYAFTLARLLKELGYTPLMVAKPGPWFAEANRISRTRRVLWIEGTALQRHSLLKRLILPIAEEISALLLAKEVREAALVISSQPGPTAFFARMGKRYWPRVRHVALVHGTTEVEWPPRRPSETISNLSGLLAATSETSSFLRRETVLDIEEIGNLFRGKLFWGDALDEVIEGFDPTGPVVFLGTLTPNKTKPLDALVKAVDAANRKMVIVGGGSVEVRLKQMVEDQNLQDIVSFAGSVDDPRPWIRRASAVVTAGRGALESMSAGRPTIIATSDGVHGLARLEHLEELERFNFTGRTPSSRQPDVEEISRHLRDSVSMKDVERLAISQRIRNMGTLDPITKQINAN